MEALTSIGDRMNYEVLTTEGEEEEEEGEAKAHSKPALSKEGVGVRNTALAPSIARDATVDEKPNATASSSPVPVTNYLTPEIVMHRRLLSYDRSTHLCPLISYFAKQVTKYIITLPCST